jgi:hypothetical protein
MKAFGTETKFPHYDHSLLGSDAVGDRGQSTNQNYTQGASLAEDGAKSLGSFYHNKPAPTAGFNV